MKTWLRACAAALSFPIAMLATLPTGGCLGTTGNKRFSFDATAGGVPRDNAGPMAFDNEVGWSITLTRVNLTIGPIYLNVIQPLRGGATTSRWLSIRSAFAHGEDHLGGGRIVGEVLGQVTFDALAATPVPFPIQGTMTQEEVRTAEIYFYPGPGVAPDTTKIDTVAADVAGEAGKDGTTIRFRGSLILDEAWLPEVAAGSKTAQSITSIRQVRGISAPFTPSEGGRLEIRVDVKRLFRGADFSNLLNAPADKDGVKLLVQAKTGKATTDQVMKNLYQGLRESNGTYSVQWVHAP